jgi:hypothetical protein
MNYEAEIILTATCAHIYKHPTTTSNAFFFKKRKKDQIHSHKMIPLISPAKLDATEALHRTRVKFALAHHTCMPLPRGII